MLSTFKTCSIYPYIRYNKKRHGRAWEGIKAYISIVTEIFPLQVEVMKFCLICFTKRMGGLFYFNLIIFLAGGYIY